MNPLLQLYKFTPPLRNVALEHTAGYCTKEDCTLCQMGYLFDMLEKANGINCQATNFLKSFSSLPQAGQHGVLEEHAQSSGSMTLMMQNLNRLMLGVAINDQKVVGRGDGEPELSDVRSFICWAPSLLTCR
jgi:PAB-dependent poly(A)-specific ribonuclease subunit 2